MRQLTKQKIAEFVWEFFDWVTMEHFFVVADTLEEAETYALEKYEDPILEQKTDDWDYINSKMWEVL